jgi:hypothetical protein
MVHNVYGHITDKQLGEFYIEIQRLQLEKERVRIVAMGAIFMFFAFIVIGFILFMIKILLVGQFLLLLIAVLIILIIATFPYIRSLKKEEAILDQMKLRLESKN